LIEQTDTQTDRPCYSVCSNRPHLAVAAIWPNNNNKKQNSGNTKANGSLYLSLKPKSKTLV